MNILYQGGFLRQGLKELGHTLISLPQAGKPLPEVVRSLDAEIDLVLLEIMGKSQIPPDMCAYAGRMALYFIDSPINSFWMKDFAKIADYVFVDQKDSVEYLKAHNIQAKWLPLCVNKELFRPFTREKQFDISFVGTVSALRPKRCNLLALLQKHCNITLRQGIPIAEMQDVSSLSCISLNENLFNGLTYRVFQCLAAGSVVLTEDGHGMRDVFTEGQHLVTYTPQNILERIDDILANKHAYYEIAEAGQDICRLHHTSTRRAETFVDAITSAQPITPREDAAFRALAESRGLCRHTLRFGGDINAATHKLKHSLENIQYADVDGDLLLGDIEALCGNFRRAAFLYQHAYSVGKGIPPLLKLANLHIVRGAVPKARDFLESALSVLRENCPVDTTVPGRCPMSESVDAYYILMGYIYHCLGQDFHLGFAKNYKNICPDTALECARMAWSLKQSEAALELMLRCCLDRGVAGEILPELLCGIENGLSSDRLVKTTADVAESYYAHDLARTIRHALHIRNGG